MTNENPRDPDPHDDAIGHLIELVHQLERRVSELTAEVRAANAASDPPRKRGRWGRPRFGGAPSSPELWAELSGIPIDDLPPRVRRGDHWDLLWRDDPEDGFHDDFGDEDPDEGGGSKVPVWPDEDPPDRSGGIALPLPPEAYEDPYPVDRPAVWHLDGPGSPRQ